MKTLLAAATVATLLVPSAVTADENADLKTLQGDWNLKSALRGGKKPPENVKIKKLKIKDSKFTIVIEQNGNERAQPTNVKLNTAKKPKQIDFFRNAGKVDSHGIYKIEGKTLTICFSNSRSDERPKKFESKEGTRVYLLVFERAKKEK